MLGKEDLEDKYSYICSKYDEIDTQRSKLEYLTVEYRLKSVYRVINHINDNLNRNKKLNRKRLQTLLVHCLNKMNGNIDGIELELDDKRRRK